MNSAGRTHPGRRGGQNEDAIGWDEANRLWFVADGMGGHASGDVASRIVRETLLSAAETPLDEAVRKAHEAVVAAATANPAHENMGSTVVAARLNDKRGQIVWVGDSRAYLWRKKALRLVTRDHSFLEMLRDQEGLSEEQMRGHPNKNLVTQTLGIGAPEPSVSTLPLRRGDWLLLCSDGLNDELDDKEIAATLAAETAPEAAAEALIAAALGKGGKDNVSVVVVEYDGPNGVSFLQPLKQNMRQWLPVAAGILSALVAAAVWVWLGGTNK
jgi:serine/threonine protein phosphatase PrpC